MNDPIAAQSLSVAELADVFSDFNAYAFFTLHGRPHESWRELVYHYVTNRPVPRCVHFVEVQDDDQMPLFV